jgi:predicted DNA-binding protein
MANTVYKTSINLPEDAVKTLRELSAQRGTTMAEIIRQAISTEKFLHEATSAGSKVLIQDKDKSVRQLVPR